MAILVNDRQLSSTAVNILVVAVNEPAELIINANGRQVVNEKPVNGARNQMDRGLTK